MIYLHEEVLNGKIRHWANEIQESKKKQDENAYYTPTYKVHKIGTDEYYALAIDLTPEERAQNGLEPYLYEATDKKIIKINK